MRVYLQARANAELPMCDQCIELDKKIEQYRRILLSVGDALTVERISALRKELDPRKITLHRVVDGHDVELWPQVIAEYERIGREPVEGSSQSMKLESVHPDV